MAAPNIVNVATITGRTTGVSLTSTAATVVVANTTASGMVLKIDTLLASNVTSTTNAAFSLAYNTSSGGGGTSFTIAKTITVPFNATLIVLDKNSQLYLEENKSLVATALTSGQIDVVTSYEEIS